MNKQRRKKVIKIISYILFAILFLIFVPFLFGIQSIFVITFISIVGYFAYLANKKHREMLEKFAKDNNFELQKNFDVKNLKGRLFSVTRREKISNVLKGNYKNTPIMIFNYRYTVGSGKNQRTYFFTVCEIEITNTPFPYIFLKSNKMMNFSHNNIFSKQRDVKVSLEDEFKKYFKLYCKEDYEIETLQIFTKDLLRFLINHGNHFSIEFSDNKIYIYDDKVIRKRKEFDVLFELSKKIIEKSGNLMHRLHDDFKAMHQFYKK